MDESGSELSAADIAWWIGAVQEDAGQVAAAAYFLIEVAAATYNHAYVSTAPLILIGRTVTVSALRKSRGLTRSDI